jgi:hypothetical protein
VHQHLAAVRLGLFDELVRRVEVFELQKDTMWSTSPLLFLILDLLREC